MGKVTVQAEPGGRTACVTCQYFLATLPQATVPCQVAGRGGSTMAGGTGFKVNLCSSLSCGLI